MDTKLNSNQPNKSKNRENLKTAAIITGAGIAGAGTTMAAGEFIKQSETEPATSPMPDASQNTKPEKEQEETQTSQEEQTSQDNTPKETPNQQAYDQPKEDNDPDIHPEKEEDNPVNREENNSQHEENPDDIPSMDDLPNVDPEIVADDLIAGEYIDPNDIDYESIPFQEVGIIETVDGQQLTAAVFTGKDGEEMAMIDVDGDQKYDYVMNNQGELVEDVQQFGITKSDSESMISEGEGLYTYTEHEDEPTAENYEDSLTDDITFCG